MQKIIRSNRRGVKVVYTVEDNPTPGTLGSHHLLLEQYRLLEKSPHFEQLLFNTYFLRKMKAKYGTLHCVYCGKKNLRIYHWKEFAGNKKNMATADHFIPRSVNPVLFGMDEDNLRVACNPCNNKKGNDYWDEKYPYKSDDYELHKQESKQDSKSLL